MKGHNVSKNLEIRTVDGQQGLYSTSLRKFIVKDLDWICYNPGDDNISVYNKRGKRGFYDANTGNLVTEAEFDKAWVFSEGLGAVEKDGLLGFLNTNGEEQIPCKFRIVRASDDWPEAIQFQKGQCLLKMSPETDAVIDRSGAWVIAPDIYSSISELSNDSCRIVVKNGKYGIVGFDGKIIVEPNYEDIRFAEEGSAYFTQNYNKYLATYSGEVLQPFVFDDIEEEVVNGYSKIVVNDKYGAVRRKDLSVVIPPKYETIVIMSDGTFKAGLYRAEPTDPATYILLDSNNRILTPKGNLTK